MVIDILTDNPKSWIVPPTEAICVELCRMGLRARRVQSHSELEGGDILILLGCETILPSRLRAKYRHSLVVHESDLPHGKGWSPMTWQVLEGKNRIPVRLIEAVDKVDSGVIHGETEIELEGHELVEELRVKQAMATRNLIVDFVSRYPNLSPKEQSGVESFYPRRTAADSELDVDRTIREQFNLLRVVDNDRYPAFFRINGKKYVLRIEKESE